MKILKKIDELLARGDAFYTQNFKFELTFVQFVATLFGVNLLIQILNFWELSANPFYSPLFLFMPLLGYALLGWFLYKIYQGNRKMFRIYHALLVISVAGIALNFIESLLLFFSSVPQGPWFLLSQLVYAVLVLFELFYLRDFWKKHHSSNDLVLSK